jgi:hypothetical protein
MNSKILNLFYINANSIHADDENFLLTGADQQNSCYVIMYYYSENRLWINCFLSDSASAVEFPAKNGYGPGLPDDIFSYQIHQFG